MYGAFLFRLFYFAADRAAPMNPEKRGWGRLGRDLNSGCAWVATNQGWSFSSIISTILPSGDIPDSTHPLAVNSSL